jgi:hypothetical protein
MQGVLSGSICALGEGQRHSAAVWTPAALTGLELYTDGTTLGAVGSALATWSDLSGTGNDLVQPYSDHLPSVGQFPNGGKAAHIPYSKDFVHPKNLQTASASALNSFASSDYYIAFSYLTPTTDQTYLTILWKGGGQPPLMIVFADHHLWRWAAGSFDSGFLLEDGNPHLIENWVDRGAGFEYLAVDGGTPASHAIGGAIDTSSVFSIGADPSSSETRDGLYGMVVAAHAIPDNTTRAKMRAYSTAQWGTP